MTASTEHQYGTEEYGRGVFTTLFVDALNGSIQKVSKGIFVLAPKNVESEAEGRKTRGVRREYVEPIAL